MGTTTYGTLDSWKAEGGQRIQQNYAHFQCMLEKVKQLVAAREYHLAAAYAEAAALHAVTRHSGLFASRQLEDLLVTIGREIVSTTPYMRKPRGECRKILHVCTILKPIGGHFRMLRRWIEQDSQHSHSVAITRQTWRNVPAVLKSAVNKSGGHVHRVNTSTGGLLAWAKTLRAIADSQDVIVLHIGSRDVLPLLAFGRGDNLPPIVLLDHADHQFWLGASISDVVVNLRESGMLLSQQRRGILPQRNILLPIPLDCNGRTLSRADAKTRLGLSQQSIVLLSVARAVKYNTIDGVDFPDSHADVLAKDQRVVLVIVGPGGRREWAESIQRAEGRIIVHGERDDSGLFYQAADIYVDSFPFISNTSLLEAGSYGTPLISRFPYSRESRILGAEMPGLEGNIICVHSAENYTDVLLQLVKNEQLRVELGHKTKQRIFDIHVGPVWQQQLETVYTAARDAYGSPGANRPPPDEPHLGEPDVFIQKVYGSQDNRNSEDDGSTTCGEGLIGQVRALPFKSRIYHWNKFINNGNNGMRQQIGALNYLVPEWFLARMRYKTQ